MQSAITNPLDTVIFRQVEIKSEICEYWLQVLEAEGVTVYQGEAGLRVTLDEGADVSRPMKSVTTLNAILLWAIAKT